MEELKDAARRQRIKSRASLVILSTLAVILLLAVVFFAVERALGDDWLPPAPTLPAESDVSQRYLPDGDSAPQGERQGKRLIVEREGNPPVTLLAAPVGLFYISGDASAISG